MRKNPQARPAAAANPGVAENSCELLTQTPSCRKIRPTVKILVLCTGNSCRSQMAEGFLKSFDPGLDVCSAGTSPSNHVHPLAVKVMSEVGIDLSAQAPKRVDHFLTESFDYVITVCDHAKETCPLFTGKVRRRLHLGFDDPAEATGTPDEVIAVFRRVRDEIRRDFHKLYMETLVPDLHRRES